MGKKAQITLFILVAILLVVGASYVLFFSKQQAPQNPLDDVKKEAENIARSDSLRVYVETCLEQATKDAVDLVGRQGGFVYDSQVGGGIYFLGPGSIWCDPAVNYFPPDACVLSANLVPYETRPGKLDYVSYGVRLGSPKSPPLYPYKGYLRTMDDLDTFGQVVGGERKGSLVELCYEGGPNDRSASGAEHSCADSYSTLGKSIQNFLKNYIENKTKQCVNFTAVSVSKGVSIRDENISADVSLGETDVTVIIHYTLSMNFNQKGTVRTIADFSYPMRNMRLKQIYELAYYLAQADTSGIFFDIQNPTNLQSLTSCNDPEHPLLKTACLKDGMAVTRMKNPCSGCLVNPYSDVIQISDSKSKIDDVTYVFQFAEQNRAPALDYINIQQKADSPYYQYLATIGKASPNPYKKRSLATASESDYDIIVGKGDSVEIYPYGGDPDEDPMSFRYLPVGGDPLAGRLESSPMYVSTKRDATAATGDLGVGTHKVQLTISDGRGLQDWQVVNILVCDLLNASAPLYCT